jgi:hypothetical protein
MVASDNPRAEIYARARAGGVHTPQKIATYIKRARQNIAAYTFFKKGIPNKIGSYI